MEEIKLAKKFYGWPEDAKFLVPDGVYDHFAAGIGKRGAGLSAAWNEQFKKFAASEPKLAHEIDLIESRKLPEGWDSAIPVFPTDAKGIASRDSSQKVLNAIAPHMPWLLGGAADLAPSTKTRLTFEGAGDLEPGSRADATCISAFASTPWVPP